MFHSVKWRNGRQTGDQVSDKKTMMMMMIMFFKLSHRVYECIEKRERERGKEKERFPSFKAGSNYWLSLDPWNKIAERNLSLLGLCHIFLSLAFPSTSPPLWIPFTWADRSLMWGGEHSHLLDSPVDQYKSLFFRVGNYRKRHWTEKSSRTFSNLKQRELR